MHPLKPTGPLPPLIELLQTGFLMKKYFWDIPPGPFCHCICHIGMQSPGYVCYMCMYIISWGWSIRRNFRLVQYHSPSSFCCLHSSSFSPIFSSPHQQKQMTTVYVVYRFYSNSFKTISSGDRSGYIHVGKCCYEQYKNYLEANNLLIKENVSHYNIFWCSFSSLSRPQKFLLCMTFKTICFKDVLYNFSTSCLLVSQKCCHKNELVLSRVKFIKYCNF